MEKKIITKTCEFCGKDFIIEVDIEKSNNSSNYTFGCDECHHEILINNLKGEVISVKDFLRGN